MKKLFVVLFAVALVASMASAQEVWGEGKMSAGPGALVALPMGDFGDAAGIGFGGSGIFQYGLSPELMLTGQIGYLSFSEKEDNFPTFSQLAFLAGAKYNLSGQPAGGFYISGQIGIVSTSVEATYFGVSYDASTSDLAFAPGVGYSLGSIDIAAKYLIVTTEGSSSSAVVLDIAYVFPF